MSRIAKAHFADLFKAAQDPNYEDVISHVNPLITYDDNESLLH